MNLKLNKKINTLSLISLVLVSFLVAYNKAEAQLGSDQVPINIDKVDDDAMKKYFYGGKGQSGDSTSDQSDALTIIHQQKKYQINDQPSLEKAFQSEANKLVNQITKDTIDWINGGFNKSGGSGSSAYISDLEGILSYNADKVVGDFIQNDPNLKFLCQPFQKQVKTALVTNYTNTQKSTSFNKKITCSASNAVTNINSGKFSWSDWLEVVGNPQNNPMGAYLTAEQEMQNKIDNKQTSIKTEVTSGNGALTYKKCTDTVYEADKTGKKTSKVLKTFSSYTGSNYLDYNEEKENYLRDVAKQNKKVVVETKCSVQTPGSVITEMLGFTANSQQRQTELKGNVSSGNIVYDSSSELLGGLLSSAINGVISNLLDSVENIAKSTLDNGVLSSTNNESYADLDSILGSLTKDAEENYNDYNKNVASSSGSTSGGLSEDARTISSFKKSIQKEKDYQTILNQALDILGTASTTFNTARVCNIYNLSDVTASGRATLIKNNILDNIETGSSENLPKIKWNVQYLNSLISISNQNIYRLNEAIVIIENSSSTEEWQSNPTVQQVASTTFNDPKNITPTKTAREIERILDITKVPTDSAEGLVRFFELATPFYDTRSCPIDSDNISDIQITYPKITSDTTQTTNTTQTNSSQKTVLKTINIKPDTDYYCANRNDACSALCTHRETFDISAIISGITMYKLRGFEMTLTKPVYPWAQYAWGEYVTATSGGKCGVFQCSCGN